MSVCSTGEATQEPTISVAVLRALLEALEDAEVPRAQFLLAAQLDPAQLGRAEARISGLKVYRLCELALELTGDPAFGLHWAERLHGSALGPLSHLIAHAGTLRKGLESLTKFERLVSDVTCHDLLEHDDTVMVRCRNLPGSTRMQRFSAEVMMAFFFRLLRAFDRNARPHCVSFKYAAPPYRSVYARVFEDMERFDQPFTGIVFDRALLDRPAPNQDDDVHEALRAVAEQRLLRIKERVPYSLRLREVLVRQGLPPRTDMPTVARALGISTRSLRRHLAAEGKSYSEVVNDALATLAKRLLRNEHTIQEASYEMGFSDPRLFHRAFKRWTGMTPSMYRDGRQSS